MSMIRVPALLLVLLLVPLASAAQTVVHITLTPNDIVREDVVLHIDANQSYNEVRWNLSNEPLSVISKDPYSIRNGTLVLEHPLVAGKNTVAFSLIFDNLVITSGSQHALRLDLQPASDTVNVTVTLPREFVLARTAGAIPPPDSMRTDGQNIMLSWDRPAPLQLAVTYQGPSTDWPAILLSALGALIIIGGVVLVLQRRQKRAVRKPLHRTLSSNESEVLGLLREGVDLQKDLIARTGYTKSKMSKVVRNLELKGVVEKTPHNRTNRLQLNKEWR